MFRTVVFAFLVLVTNCPQSNAFEMKTVDQAMENSEIIQTLQTFGRAIHSLQETMSQIVKDFEMFQRNSRCDGGAYYNTTVEELEVRVEQLEADLFETQNDVLEVEAEVLEIEFSLQEVNEQVLDQADSISSLTDVTSGHTEELLAVEDDLSTLNSSTTEQDSRISFLENEFMERSKAAFLVRLSDDVNIPDNTVVPFDEVVFDDGFNFNTTTHAYVTPVNGTYLFYTHLFYINDDACGSRLLVDGQSVVFSQEARAIDGGFLWSKLIIIQELREGQNVQLRTVGGNEIRAGGDIQTYFGGHLLFIENE